MLWITDINFELAQNSNLQNTAYFKAKTDYTQYIKELNAKVLHMYLYYWKDEPLDSINGRIDGMLAGFHQGDTLIIQLPIMIRPLNIQILIEHIKNAFHGKVIAMIHDYEPLFYEQEKINQDSSLDPLLDAFNINTYSVLLPQFDALIVHSEQFKEVLKTELGYQKPIIVQGPFGYRIASEINIPNHNFSRSIIFAGYLAKAKYLSSIPQNWNLDVFGPMISEKTKKSSNIIYHGNFLPTELPSHLPDGFGLVWASDTYPGVEGTAGTYTKIIYPHKISAYLVAKIPLIVWSKSAAADWIQKNGLGFAVDSLDQVAPILEKMTEETYHDYQHNLIGMSNLIREGIFEKNAALRAYMAVNEVNYTTKY